MFGTIRRWLIGVKKTREEVAEESELRKELAGVLSSIDYAFESLMAEHDRLDHSLRLREMYEAGDLEYRVQADLSVINSRRRSIEQLNVRLQELKEQKNRLLYEIEAEKGTSK